MEEPEKRRGPRWLRVGLGAGSAVLFGAGLLVAFLARELMVGVVLFAVGAIFFALRGYLETKDKVLAGALIFVAVVAIGIEAVVYLLGP